MSYLSRLDKTARILRETAASGDWGDTGTLTQVAAVPCRIQASSGNETADGKIRSEATHLVFMEMTGLLTTDWLEIDGVRYDIIPPLIDAGGAGHHLQAWVKEHDA
ncbi:MAG: hypothetical protein WC096_00890 [Sphaerochaetaceae bacterium]